MTSSPPPPPPPGTGVGYDADFLDVPVPPPAVEPGRVVRELTYTHFTVWLDPVRRLAAATAVNVDGAGLVEVERDDAWFLNPRAPADEQVGEEVYADNDLDRGHLVRRRDPVWGPLPVAEAANTATFAFPNAAPQVAGFNHAEELWLGLEDYVLEAARAAGSRLSVFTGPVLADDDPTYRGVGIPRLFWKVAAWATADGSDSDADDDGARRLVLAATGYVLDQGPQLDQLDLEVAAGARAAGGPALLGPFRTFQVPITDITALTGLDLGPLEAADRYQPTPGQEPGRPRVSGQMRRSGWRELTDPGQITL